MPKHTREVDLIVLSDLHLGTYGCRAQELLQYMKSVKPKRVILNGDIIDIWQFKKSYFPKTHMKVVKQLMSWIADGVQVDYITGNHDEMLRKFNGFELGSFKICNKVMLNLPDGKAWIFHGDVFDVTMKYSKWLAKLGAVGYDTLIMINIFVNWCLKKLGKGRISLSKKIKNSVKGAIKFIDDFEQTAADIAIDNNYEYVICGHIHQPQKRVIENEKGAVNYLNSGDWIENLSALEYHENTWKLVNHEELFQKLPKIKPDPEEDLILETDHLFEKLVEEFNLMKVS
ncbi:UDP-2,3-diacylglucosamine diphosphatase [Salibacter halophilus]|uniref:UDP-2,3-diacylglucosamine diphosphatase n=1 Tax=Salibacter halophilus TaxID=1803916 RepID=A0A6N6M7D9_9FLAO|nr:UDP-2,3-diacylglucosamine diphosphatase [Salibacter halophilus]KAB1063718.1 UDP-2,3-diacylglucosamine diphosphatase [Salibacter halophilus]